MLKSKELLKLIKYFKVLLSAGNTLDVWKLSNSNSYRGY